MTTWVLALVLLAAVAALGYRQGGIRVAFSFFGILVGVMLAVPLGRPLGRLLGMVGLQDPLLVSALGPVLVFVIVSAVFKIAAAAVHTKADVHYKYHGGDLRLVLWERLNHRLGLCLGLLNGSAYLILLSFLIYVPSYLTYQLASSDSDPKWMRLLDRMGQDLHATGFAKAARSVDSIPQADFQMADLAALIYRNPLLEARLANYPAFLGLGELPQFQDLGNDREFMQQWASGEPVMNLLQNPKIQGIRANPDLLKSIWASAEPNLEDVRTYLATGTSPRFDPTKILGRWKFDAGAAINAIRRTKPNISSLEMLRLRRVLDAAFSKAELIAMPDNQVTLRDCPGLRFSAAAAAAAIPPPPAPAPPPPPLQTLQGQWKDANGKYLISFSGQDLPTTVENDRIHMQSEALDWVFQSEE